MQDIPGYENYTISKDGVVVNKKTGRIVKQGLISKGYYAVRLAGITKSTNHYVHRLLGLIYIPNPENKPHINHINGIRTDNRLCNLEWSTPKENIQHAYRIGLVPKIIKVMQGAKFSESQIIELRANHLKGYSIKELANKYCMSAMNVHHIIKRKTWTHI